MLALTLGKTIFSLYLIMAAGFIMQKAGVFKKNESRILSLLVLYLVMPALIFSAYQIEALPRIRNGLILAVTASVVIHIFLLILAVLLKQFLKYDALERASIIYSNCGNLIVPLVYIVFGKEYVVYCTGYMTVFNILLWSHGEMLISGEKVFHLRKIILNPNMIAVACGLVMFFTGWHLPLEVQKSVDLLAGCIGPLTMLVIGMLLAELDWKSIAGNPNLFMIVAWRLLLVQMAVLVILHYFPWYCGLDAENGRNVLLITYIASMAPAANAVTMLAQKYDRNAVYANAIGVVSTVLCIFTMPLLVWLYQAW